MEKYIKSSVVVVAALYAFYAATIGVMYVMNIVELSVVGDWLLKGVFVGLIVFGLSVVLALLTRRSK